MSRRQLKNISQYDEILNLKNAMSLTDEDVKLKPDRKTYNSFLDLVESSDEVVESESPTDIVPEKVKPKKKKKKSNKKSAKEKKKILESAKNEETELDNIVQNCQETTQKLNMNSMLKIESKYLDPETELKRIFGVSAVSGARNNRNNHRRQARRGTIVRWDNTGGRRLGSGGVNMVQDNKEGNDGLTWWRFTHDKEYQETQSRFLAAARSGSHEILMGVLQHNPMHCDTLILLSDACMLQGDTNASRELIEALLFVMENALHPRCVISTGKNCFDYRRPENRSFFGGLFRYCQLSATRGCWRTALEQAKLLLSFDNTDPLAIVLLIPLYALKSGKYEELIQMELELSFRDVKSLPNWSLSVALSLIYLDRLEEAQSRLEECFTRHPGLLFPLLDKLEVEPCKELKSATHFNITEPPAKQLLYKIITVRETDFWKEPKAQSVLDFVTQTLVNSGRKEHNSNTSSKIPPQIMRHAMICGIHVESLSVDESLSYDPVPPENSILEYTPKPASEEPAHVNLNFLMSMLPGYQGGEAPLGNVQQQLGELVGSMLSVLDQIRAVQDVPDLDEATEEFD